MNVQQKPTLLACNTDTIPLKDGVVRLLGAVQTVTPTITQVEAGGLTVLVDCGIEPGFDADEDDDQNPKSYTFDYNPEGIDAVILTHGHLDHVGGLQRLLSRDFAGPIFGTPPTLALTRLLLADGLRIAKTKQAESRRILARFDRFRHPLRYGQRTALDALIWKKPGRSACSMDLTFHEAGHIIGSSSVELNTPQSRIIISGDLGRPASPILRDYNTTWDSDRPVDLVLMETTYADREHGQTHEEVAQELLKAIEHALKDGGHILVPAFAIGRTQLLLYHLNALVESGRLKNLPVAVDTPLGLRVTNTYSDFEHLYDEDTLEMISKGDDPFAFDGLSLIRRHPQSEAFRDLNSSALIIAGSGMCTGGRIVGHLQELLPRPETCVLFVGFLARGTPGRAILNARSAPSGSRSVRIGRKQVTVGAAVHFLSGMSAHADRHELNHWLQSIPGVRQVALHHGENNSQEAFTNSWNSKNV